MWIKQTHIQEEHNYLCYQKPLISGVISTLVEGTGPATTMLSENHIQKT
jgi:hypothetical protein